uniref:Uncharacterized protein n=1 Tax=Kalanchoe fedtschenkoi TaxID=63787 RepID=A0A7N0T0P6_KALFE
MGLVLEEIEDGKDSITAIKRHPDLTTKSSINNRFNQLWRQLRLSTDAFVGGIAWATGNMALERASQFGEVLELKPSHVVVVVEKEGTAAVTLVENMEGGGGGGYGRGGGGGGGYGEDGSRYSGGCGGGGSEGTGARR